MVIKHDAGLLVTEKPRQMRLEISIQVLMALGFHEDLHRLQNLLYALATVVGTSLLLLLLECKQEAIDN